MPVPKKTAEKTAKKSSRPPWLEVLDDGTEIIDLDEMAAEDEEAALPELDRRIARLSRRTARFMRTLRDDGEHAIAERFGQLAGEIVAEMRGERSARKRGA